MYRNGVDIFLAQLRPLKALPFLSTQAGCPSRHAGKDCPCLFRNDMFPLKALGSIRVFLRLIATTREIHLMPSVGTATVELGFMSSIDLRQEFLGMVKRIDSSVLG